MRTFICFCLLLSLTTGCVNPQKLTGRSWQAPTLPLQGDPIAGEKLFFSSELACAQCHRVGDRGGQVAPDLTDAHRRFSRERLAAELLQPSDRVSDKYQQTTIADVRGNVYVGVVHRKTADPIELYQQDGQLVRIPRADVDELRQQTLSPMPNDYADRLTVRQLADLIEFLTQPNLSVETIEL